MNATIEALFSRKSVRAYTDEEITPEEEQVILEAACQAPTAGNQQMYSIIVVRDRAKIEALIKSCDNQPFIGEAQLVLAFCADVRRWWRVFEAAGCEPRDPGPGDMVLAMQDALIAAQNAVTAAESLGIGSCYIGDFMEHYDEQRSILNLPKYVVPATILVLGYPTQQQKDRKKPPRFDLDVVVFEDEYRDLPVEDVRAACAKKIGSVDASRGPESIKAFCDRKWNSGFSCEMSRSIAQALEQFTFRG
ncbi:MAG: nitroreductase family protein [Coriobacteriales bacterium]|nr:nitroreductase family protein [Coriobacteriales bacterium]